MTEKTEDLTINVRGIIVVWLMERDFDGLAGCQCGCRLDDLMPCAICDNNPSDCVPGSLGADPDDPDDWCMYGSKEEAEASKKGAK